MALVDYSKVSKVVEGVILAWGREGDYQGTPTLLDLENSIMNALIEMGLFVNTIEQSEQDRVPNPYRMREEENGWYVRTPSRSGDLVPLPNRDCAYAEVVKVIGVSRVVAVEGPPLEYVKLSLERDLGAKLAPWLCKRMGEHITLVVQDTKEYYPGKQQYKWTLEVLELR